MELGSNIYLALTSTLLLLCSPSCFALFTTPHSPTPLYRKKRICKFTDVKAFWCIQKTSSTLQSSSSNPDTTVMSSTTWPPSSSIQRSHAWTIWHGVVWKSGTLPTLSKKKTPSGSSISEPPKKTCSLDLFTLKATRKTSPPPQVAPEQNPMAFCGKKNGNQLLNGNQWNDYNMKLWLWTIFHHGTPRINKTPHLFGQVGRCIHRPHSRVILETKSANIPGTYWNVGSWEIVVNQVGFCFALRFFPKLPRTPATSSSPSPSNAHLLWTICLT